MPSCIGVSVDERLLARNNKITRVVRLGVRRIYPHLFIFVYDFSSCLLQIDGKGFGLGFEFVLEIIELFVCG
ncbi:unnamed protein product [Periconia digitata]|uniref:Uncharacterized protein n=1 Tax=Periconia digitata TaxID=1303443 RepID=A0A9W4XRB3_9PLEO|nr:unnamed protein product [Periconia digitata]